MTTKYKLQTGTIYYDKKVYTIEEVLEIMCTKKPTIESTENKHCEWENVCSLFGCTYNQFMAERKFNEKHKS